MRLWLLVRGDRPCENLAESAMIVRANSPEDAMRIAQERETVASRKTCWAHPEFSQCVELHLKFGGTDE